jgi:transposase-like protein
VYFAASSWYYINSKKGNNTMNDNNNYNTTIDDMVQLLILEKEKAFPKILAAIYDQAMIAEREAHLCAGSYERSESRDGYANGFKPRSLQTRVGRLSLHIPQVRGSNTKFYPKCLDRGTRSERAIMLTAAEMYIHGVSTRRVEAVFQAMGIDNYSAEQVSNASKILDEELIKWRTRRITQCVKVIYVDATYQKVRIDGVAVNLATFIVTGILEDGHRTILAVDSDISEAELHWRRVFRELIDRGLRGVKLIVSDAHEGLAAARQAVFSGVPWQRCQLHLQQNAQAYITKRSLKEQVASDIRAIFNASSMDEAKRLLDIMVEKYAKDQQKLSAWMRDNIPEGLIVFMFPEHMRKKLRTNNIEERINRSIKARTRIISVFPNQMSQLRLVSAICMEISDDWETGTTYLNVNEL